MKINTVNAESAPQAAGGYSQGVAVSGAERLLFISGQIPETMAGDVPNDFPAQDGLVWGLRPVVLRFAPDRRCTAFATYLRSLAPRA